MKSASWVKQCFDHCRRYTKAWDYYALSADSFLAGFRAAREAANNPNLGLEEVEFPELLDGMHQLTPRTFAKQKVINYALPFETLLKSYIPMVEFTDIRVEEKDGVISFQGTGKRVNITSDFGEYVQD